MTLVDDSNQADANANDLDHDDQQTAPIQRRRDNKIKRKGAKAVEKAATKTKKQ